MKEKEENRRMRIELGDSVRFVSGIEHPKMIVIAISKTIRDRIATCFWYSKEACGNINCPLTFLDRTDDQPISKLHFLSNGIKDQNDEKYLEKD